MDVVFGPIEHNQRFASWTLDTKCAFTNAEYNMRLSQAMLDIHVRRLA